MVHITLNKSLVYQEVNEKHMGSKIGNGWNMIILVDDDERVQFKLSNHYGYKHFGCSIHPTILVTLHINKRMRLRGYNRF